MMPFPLAPIDRTCVLSPLLVIYLPVCMPLMRPGSRSLYALAGVFVIALVLLWLNRPQKRDFYGPTIPLPWTHVMPYPKDASCR